jgi:hypothetical protein
MARCATAAHRSNGLNIGMVLHRSRRKHQRLGDFAVSEPASQHSEDVDLAIGEVVRPGSSAMRQPGRLNDSADRLRIETTGTDFVVQDPRRL